ncbi:glycoside hydrolase family 25 protein [Scleroderma citrinum Foug A]|uniref:Glycoside hydrolase family 25 protein n=1 Tax=Scleroderma citrinum Foug A TaxID=1036808 RepID=A0A0C3DP99_9AGAM|nr:glycoside hydrolase family 25 protein [Scleroderma citrinum Foug A]
MKLCRILAALPAALSVVHGVVVQPVYPLGIDVSSQQLDVDWTAVAANGISFAYTMASEGTVDTSAADLNSEFSSQFTGAARAGLIRGAFHLALPNLSSGAAQAAYFLNNGGHWVADNITLPGALDVGYDPNGSDECYNMSASEMVAWIQDFSDTYHRATTRYPGEGFSSIHQD